METTTKPDLLKRVCELEQTRESVCDAIEALGAVATALREALSDLKAGNEDGAGMSADDAMAAAAEAQDECAKLGRRIFAWIGGAA